VRAASGLGGGGAGTGDERLSHPGQPGAGRWAHPEFVFVYRGRPIETMHNTAWQSARRRAGLPQVRVHDLKHTFGRRLRAVGVSFEDRQDLLGHRSGRITTHYSAAERARQDSNRRPLVCRRDSCW